MLKYARGGHTFKTIRYTKMSEGSKGENDITDTHGDIIFVLFFLGSCDSTYVLRFKALVPSDLPITMPAATSCAVSVISLDSKNIVLPNKKMFYPQISP